jgi:hypothetical protein
VVEARFAHGGDDYPVALEIDRVAVTLVDRGHAPACERAIEWVASAFAFERDDELLFFAAEAAKNGVSKLAIDLDVCFARKSVTVGRTSGACVAEKLAKEIRDEVRQEVGFLELIRAAGRD